MNPDRFTIKSQEALERAQRLASERSHQELRPEHLLAALLDDAGGTVVAVLEKLGVQREPLAQANTLAMDRLPRVQGGSLFVGDALRLALERAEKVAEQLKDEFVSVEHLLLALADPEPPTDVQRALAKAGVSRDGVMRALAQVRGGQRVTDASPEDKYQALTKYGRDLTAMARQGKLLSLIHI